ncbi:MAG TPA: hypothetical protein PKD55_22165 [Bellilinea sp.]|jgi:hypothetical protein|nr:hypothetical protein [Bellilinea sp.]
MFGSSKTKIEQQEAERIITELLAKADIGSAQEYFNGLGWFDKRSYKSMLNQLKQGAFLVRLLHGGP